MSVYLRETAAAPAVDAELRRCSDGGQAPGHWGRATRRRARVAAAALVTAALCIVASACGGSPGSGVAQLGSTTPHSGAPAPNAAATSSQHGGALAFARCMRAHGVPSFPDPSGNGQFDKAALRQLATSNPRFAAAQRVCQHLLPVGSAAEQRQGAAQALQFSHCMRSHGVTRFPDPAGDGRIPDPATLGIDQGSPRFEAANQACGRYRPPYMPSNAAYNAYAATQHGS